MRWAIWLALIEAILPCVVANAAGPLQSSAQFQPIILTPAGSTGGTIGKQDKSASGGEEKLRPRRTRKQVLRPHHTREQVVRPSKPETQSKRMHGKSSATPRIAVGGRWRWYATCALGNIDGVITLEQTMASTFHGSFGGLALADFGIITDGTVRGKHLSFLRHDPAGWVERYDADLVSKEPPTVKGYHVYPPLGACHFIGTKM